MTKETLIEALHKEGKFSFSRSGGPGGQNVNKVNTKVLLTVPLDKLDCFEEEEVQRIKEKLKNRLNSEGELYIQFQEERSQLMNREKAIEKMTELITQALFVQKKRKKTRPGKAAVQRRLDGKKRQSHKKKSRGNVGFND